MEELFITEQERKKIEVLRNENKIRWEEEQAQLEAGATRRGETFTPGEYKEVSDAAALAAVRAGWKSRLDRQFEKKWQEEAKCGLDWSKQHKKL